jgi:hypothetical protein
MPNFWLEDVKHFFSSIQVLPMGNMTMEEQLNALSRLILIIFVVMLLLNFKYSVQFLVISLSFIIIVYYIQRKTMQTCTKNDPNKIVENFAFQRYDKAPIEKVTPLSLNNLAQSKKVLVNGSWKEDTFIEGPQNLAFCNDEVSIDPPSSFAVNLNQNLKYGMYAPPPSTGKEPNMNDGQQLSAGCNPLTKIAPVVVAPSYELSYWKQNNLVENSHINRAGPQEDMYLSGYGVSTCCDYLPDGSELIPRKPVKRMTSISGSDFKEEYNQCGGGIKAPYPSDERVYVPEMQVQENYCGGIRAPYPSDERPFVPEMRVREDYCGGIKAPYPSDERPWVPEMPVRENYNPPAKYADLNTVKNPKRVAVQPDKPGWVNTSCGYNPGQIYRSGLPSNFPAGNCMQDPKLKRFNENLFTQTVTPGVYTTNQIIEPISSNIGISFQQQFEPVTCSRDDKGLTYTQHDPRIIQPASDEATPLESEQQATYDNVYDPRFYGYGTSYRSYIDQNLGQPRFMYDDINSIRHPAYITRSKIDHLPYADKYGPIQENSEFGNIHTPNIRALAQDSWLRDSLQFRNDISERRMRKINSEAWERRLFPIGPRQR